MRLSDRTVGMLIAFGDEEAAALWRYARYLDTKQCRPATFHVKAIEVYTLGQGWEMVPTLCCSEAQIGDAQ